MLFTFPQSVGIAGGRPSSSYYFVASQASSLFYLDPHLTRPAVPLETPPACSNPVIEPEDAEEAVVVDRPSPIGRESPVHVPYTLDVIDVDDLSDDSGSSTSPTNRLCGRKRSSAVADQLSSPPATPSVPAPSGPDTPSTPVSTSDPFRKRTPVGAASSSVGPSRPTVDPQTVWYANAYSEAQLRTFHCEKVKKMPLSGLDPSMLLGFMCRDGADFEDFCERVAKVSGDRVESIVYAEVYLSCLKRSSQYKMSLHPGTITMQPV